VLAVISALASSLMYALASVLQQRGAAAQPEHHSMRFGLLIRLLRHRGWLVGVACDAAGYVLQFVALGHGPIVVVQPLLVCGILFALPIGAAWSGRPMRTADWLWAVVVCAGLAVFLTVANPAAGRDNVHPFVWVLLLGTDAAAALVLIGLSVGRSPRRRAFLLSTAAGVLYGAAAALTKTSAHLLEKRLWHVLLHWQPYALVVVGVVGMLVAQSAFQAGALDVSLPAMSVVDPVVSVAIGAFAFGETLVVGPAATTLEVLALIGMSVGVVLLARSEVGARADA
jgi:drug/metabolite transporter (DMT)-like permease